MSIDDLKLLIRIVSKRMHELPVSDPEFDDCVRIYNTLCKELKRVERTIIEVGNYQ